MIQHQNCLQCSSVAWTEALSKEICMLSCQIGKKTCFFFDITLSLKSSLAFCRNAFLGSTKCCIEPSHQCRCCSKAHPKLSKIRSRWWTISFSLNSFRSTSVSRVMLLRYSQSGMRYPYQFQKTWIFWWASLVWIGWNVRRSRDHHGPLVTWLYLIVWINKL